MSRCGGPVGMDLSIVELVDALHRKLAPTGDLRQIRQEFSISQLDDLERRLAAVHAAIHSIRNAFLPIHSLPRETLALIFSKLAEPFSPSSPSSSSPSWTSWLPDLPSHPAPYAWLHATHVCRYWRTTASCFPALWATVDASHPAAALAALARSKAAKLTVHLRDKTYYSHLRPTLGDPALVGTLAAQSERYEALVLEPQFRYPAALLHAFSHPAPSLQSLTIARDVGAPEHSAGALPRLFGGCTPRLERLALCGYAAWPENSFVRLTHVCLYDQPMHARPCLSSFLDFLAGSPRMQQLVLVDAGPVAAESDAPRGDADRRIVSLRELKTLDVGDWPGARSVACFLAHLALPESTAVNIWGAHLLRGGETLHALLPPDLTHLRPLHGLTGLRAATPDTEKERGPQLLSLRENTLCLQGDFYAPAVLPSLFDTLDTRQVQSLMVATDAASLRRETWLEIFTALPALTHLTIAHMPSRALLAALTPSHSYPSTPAEPGRQLPFPCPALTHLTICDRALSPVALFLAVSERATREGGSALKSVRVLRGTAPYSQRLDDDLAEMGAYIGEVAYLQWGLEKGDVELPGWPSEGYQWVSRRRVERRRRGA
ncbi:hypothetical protein AcV7_007735 [Taiwanofungus camphoratus]|nr:hypothetical protein AcV7_007735 [Antrodia cinnamomea]